MKMKTVLLAEDHPVIRRSVAEHLAKVRDIDVIGEAENGHGALRLAEELQPDVLLLDISMPGLSGIEVAWRLRADNSPVKLLVFSTYANAGRVQAMLDNDVEGYLTKQEPVNQVLAAIRGVARGERGYYSQEVKDCLLHQYVTQTEAAGDLTARELEVLQQLITGKTNRAIGRALAISEKTVERHLDKIYRKLNVSSRTEAAVTAIQHEGLFQGEMHALHNTESPQF